ncbi:hypothetical protein [uncultured Bartonella sp.]|uniref:hypothetical protein n=1 Tax=uncultured Bartonella sp. TaxID=104108 RepID=UPI00260619B3|nr:hypothetical protein [uncultured Bartonella sp.]
MNANAQTHKMFLTAISDMAQSVRKAKPASSFSWGDVKPYLKSLAGKSRQAKVMSLAWQLYRHSAMTGPVFDPVRFAFYVSCAHAEVKAEDEPPVTMSRKEIMFIGSDCASEPER